MKKTLVTMLVMGLVLGFAFTASAIHDLLPDGLKVIEPGADAEKLYNYITKPKSYSSSWNLLPGTQQFYSGNQPHGSLLITYVNDAALSSIKSMQEMPFGSCIVNEEYSADKQLTGITVMYKVKDYNPEGGDWFWAKYAPPDGYVVASGKVESCIVCHDAQKDNNYLFSKK
ncbi:MAG: cytochrome P460 family protein [Dissulfurispiraceae bacterium]